MLCLSALRIIFVRILFAVCVSDVSDVVVVLFAPSLSSSKSRMKAYLFRSVYKD